MPSQRVIDHPLPPNISRARRGSATSAGSSATTAGRSTTSPLPSDHEAESEKKFEDFIRKRVSRSSSGQAGSGVILPPPPQVAVPRAPDVLQAPPDVARVPDLSQAAPDVARVPDLPQASTVSGRDAGAPTPDRVPPAPNVAKAVATPSHKSRAATPDKLPQAATSVQVSTPPRVDAVAARGAKPAGAATPNQDLADPIATGSTTPNAAAALNPTADRGDDAAAAADDADAGGDVGDLGDDVAAPGADVEDADADVGDEPATSTRRRRKRSEESQFPTRFSPRSCRGKSHKYSDTYYY